MVCGLSQLLLGTREAIRRVTRRANHRFGCPVPFAKIFSFSFHPNQIYIRRVPLPLRGVSRSSRTWGAGCGGRGSVWARDVMAGRVDKTRERSNGELTNGADADGEVVWS